MTWWVDRSYLFEVPGAALVALAAASAACLALVRGRHGRRRGSRRTAALAAYRPNDRDPIEGREGEPVRMTLLADVHEPGEVEKAEAWLRAHAGRLTYLSREGGCGCCVIDWDVEGPREVIETLPNSLRCGSDWTRGEHDRDRDDDARPPVGGAAPGP